MSVPVSGRRPAVIFDVDGTLADVSSIRHHIRRPARDFGAFHDASLTVPAHKEVVAMTHTVRAAGCAVVVVTARRARWSIHTLLWLREHGVGHDELYMRGDRDGRRDVEVKRDILALIRREFDVVGAVDDNPAILALWESEGIPTTRVPGWEEAA